VKTISCGLTYDDRDMLRAKGELSAAARAVLKSATVLVGHEPLQLVDIPEEIGREIRDACQRLGLHVLALNLTTQIKKANQVDL
jgi:hypothetical protein